MFACIKSNRACGREGVQRGLEAQVVGKQRGDHARACCKLCSLAILLVFAWQQHLQPGNLVSGIGSRCLHLSAGYLSASCASF